MSFASLAAVGSFDSGQVVGALGLLLDSALKGAVLIGAAALAAYLLRTRSAAARHAAWTAAVVGHLILPALTLVTPSWQLGFLPAPPWSQVAAPAAAKSLGNIAQQQGQTARSEPTSNRSVSTSAPTVAATGTQTGIPAATSNPISTPAVRSSTAARERGFIGARLFNVSGLQLLAFLWVLGTVVVLLRLVFGTIKVGQLARDGSRVTDGAWLSLAQRTATRLGIDRPLTLLHGSRLGIPVTWGIVYPAVLLPPDAEEWPESRRRFVLVHEMAHVKRFDALTQLAAQIAVAIFWFDPLIWLAAHRLRVEREHACDDYVLRDGTTPSLYAGELLDMVRSLGTPAHERAAPAFAALAMARRSEFEGRMLAILDPKLDRHTLDRRSTLLTGALVMLLVLPLAALRPFQPPTIPAASVAPAERAPEKPRPVANAVASRSCDSAILNTKSRTTSTHISVDDDAGSPLNLTYLVSTAGRCAEASMNGRPRLSEDETVLLGLPQGAVATFRELIPGSDRSVTVTPAANGSLTYTAHANGRLVEFDQSMRTWLSSILPEVMRESAIDVPQRVTRWRRSGGVSGVLSGIATIKSSAAKTAHYQALLDGDFFTQDEIDRIASTAARDLAATPSDLRAVLDHTSPPLLTMPRVSEGALIIDSSASGVGQRTTGAHYPSAAARVAIAQSVVAAVKQKASSGEKAALLSQYAATGDPESVLLVLRGAKEVTADGDKANLLKTVTAKALTPRRSALRHAFFEAAATLNSDGAKRDVLIAAAPYGHADPSVTAAVIEAVSLIHSAGDKAAVLIAIAEQRLLTSPAMRQAFLVAAKQITSSGDYSRVLEAAIDK